MRILYVLPHVPWPIKVRSYNLIPRLAQKHQIHLVALRESAPARWWTDNNAIACCERADLVAHSRVRAVLQCAVAAPTPVPLRIAYCRSAGMEAAVQRSLDEFRPDVIYVERWRALQYVPPDAAVPVLCDPTDSMGLYNRRLFSMGKWWERLIAAEEYIKFRRYEPYLASQATATVFCSGIDLQYVQTRCPQARFDIVPNGVDSKLFFRKSMDEEQANTIVFSGSFAYAPNRLAVRFFLRDIFPHIRRDIPGARFIAVGNGGHQYLDFYRRDGIEIHDFVPDLRAYLAAATVAVAPMTLGTGVSNKLLEAFSVGTPVVSTPVACGDLPVSDGKHLFVAADAKAFARCAIELMGDSSLRKRIADSAHEFVTRDYDWEVVAGQMEMLLADLVQCDTNRRFVERQANSAPPIVS